jgi:Ca-activated chloride channel family protein
VDGLDEAQKVFVDEMRSTLVTVAKDAKLQIEFDPSLVAQYRLIGYEKRMLRAQDFNNDRKDAGDVGAGKTVTALYEIVPVEESGNGDLMTVKLRYKEPEAATSQLLTATVKDQRGSWRGTSTDFRFAASVAAFGLILRDSPYKGDADFNLVLQLANGARGRDDNGYRREFVSMANRARSLAGNLEPVDE